MAVIARTFRTRIVIAAMLGLAWVSSARGAVGPDNVVLIWNSGNTVSTAVRALYIAAHAGVHEVDLADATLGPGSVSRADYVAKIRTPVRDFINGTSTGTDLSNTIMIVATTRGLPARIISPVGTDEFVVSSAWASVESELTLLQQNLELGGTAFLPFHYDGAIDNPYHRSTAQPIDSFSRVGVKTPRSFSAVATPTGGGGSVEAWQVTGLTPGDMYLVCRIDSGPAAFNDMAAVDNIAALLTRSASASVCAEQVQVLLDEYGVPPATFELDSGEFPPLFLGVNDFELTATFMTGLGVDTLHDKTTAFITGPDLADQTKPAVVLGTYGENHSINGWGANPPGPATYIGTYDVHPASMFLGIESWSGTSMYAPAHVRTTQQEQVLDFIEHGGSFTVGNVMEPFTFGVADLEMIAVNMLGNGLTFAEAAWSAIPALGWQNVPVGDPLARIVVTHGAAFDRNGDNRLDAEDLYVFHAAPMDHNCDGVVDDGDRVALRDAIRRGEGSAIVAMTP